MAEPKKWIQGAMEGVKPGGLHRALKIPMGQKIPAERIAEAKRSNNPRIRKMASLAQTFAKIRPK